MTLRGLSQDECGRLLTGTAERPVSEADVRALHSRSDGNPFFATELARLMSEEGGLAGVPSGVRDVIARRVGLLPEATARLLEVAAVIGRQVDVALLAHVAERSLDEVLDDLDPALDRRLLEVPAGGAASLRFPHALVREALVDGTTPLRRARLHLRTADAILALLGDTDDTAEIVAEHLWAAAAVGAGSRAAAALERGAGVALRRQALGSAYSLLERSAQLYRAAGGDGMEGELRVLRLLSFVEGTRMGYRAARASPYTGRARQLARSAGQPELLFDIIWTEWAGCDTGGEPDRAWELVAEADEVARELDNLALDAAVTAMRAFSLRHSGRMLESHREAVRAVQQFEAAGAQTDAAAYLNSSLTVPGYRFFAEAFVSGHDEAELERVFRTHELPFGQLVIAMFGAATSLVSGEVADLRRWSERMQAADTDVVMSFWSGSVEVYTAIAQLHDGELAAGWERLSTGLAMMADGQATAMVPGVLAEAARALARHGDLERARSTVEQARRALDQHGEECYRPLVLLAAADVLDAGGDSRAAAGLASEAEEVARKQGSARFAERVRTAYSVS